MLKEIKQRLRKKNNTKDIQIQSLKEENRKLLKKIDEKNDLIISLYYLRDEKDNKIKELLEENETLQRHKKRISKE